MKTKSCLHGLPAAKTRFSPRFFSIRNPLELPPDMPNPHLTEKPVFVPARLALEDGSVFEGLAFGDTSPRVVGGEVCFNTSMSGYQEILTDPSYAGQIITMTCPLIGNYGIAKDDMESKGIHARGFIVRELSNRVSNFRAEKTLSTWLKENGVVGLTGIDTRALTRRLRVTGAMQGVICTDAKKTDAELVAAAKAEPSLNGRNLAAGVACDAPCGWGENLGDWAPLHGHAKNNGKTYKVVALDCGAKHNILRNLTDQGFEVTVLPWDATPEQILAGKPDGIFISNGPGDPAAVEATIANLRALLGAAKPLPTFGICLGHQLLSLALGAKTYKLKFGHRGGNHPIQNLGTGKVEITSQNHGFAVERASLEAVGGEVTHINLNDDTVAGFRHKTLPVFAIQYHPEASPGPHDSRYLFDCFRTMIESGQSPSTKDMDKAQRMRSEIEQVAAVK